MTFSHYLDASSASPQQLYQLRRQLRTTSSGPLDAGAEIIINIIPSSP